MKISVVVPNHGRDLSLLKRSIEESTYKNIELIVIDRGLERSKQRNLGILESTGDVILWLDSDQSVSKDLLKEAVDLFKEGYHSLYVPEIITDRSLFGRIRAWERSFMTGTAVDVPRFVLRGYLPSYPYFDESLIGPEDACFGNRLNGFRGITKNVLYHDDKISMVDYFKKKAFYSKSMKRYAEKWPNDPCLNFKYRCFEVYVRNGKWKKLLRHPFLSLNIIYILLIRGILYLCNR